MINAHAECEMVRVLNKHEAEAIPLQRIRRSQHKLLPFGWRHLAMVGRDEFDVSRIINGPTNDVFCIGVLEPAAVGVVATKVRVDDVRHRTDITPPGYVPRGNDQPCHIEAPVRVPAKGAEVFSLHIAGWHSTYRRLPGFGDRRRGRVPRHGWAWVRHPVVD